MAFIITLKQIQQLKAIISAILELHTSAPQLPNTIPTNVPSIEGVSSLSTDLKLGLNSSTPGSSIQTPIPTPTPAPQPIQPCIFAEKTVWMRYGSKGGPAFPTNSKLLKDYDGWDEKTTKSEKCIMTCGTEAEGGAFDAVQGYDSEIITVGAMQKTVDPSGFGQLPKQLADFRKIDPEKFEELFFKKGIIIKEEKNPASDSKEPRLYYKDPYNDKATEITGADLKKVVNQDGNKDEWVKEENATSSNNITSIFRDAGNDPDFQKQQVNDIQFQMNAAISQKPKGYDYPISDYMTSDKGRATILDQRINRPGYVKDDFGAAVDRFYEKNPKVSKNPAEWGENRATYEQGILEDYGVSRRGTDMESRFNKIKNCQCES
ncbi:MAG: hypothetical protein IPO83_18025 [Chitinophagaceae bacterium]|nr:hypothetical protein [Chitinophagaceae bacterium]